MRTLFHELPVLLPFIIAIVTIIGLKAFGLTLGGVFLTILGALMPSQREDGSSGGIVVGPIKLNWQGASSIGLLLAGLLLIIWAFYAYMHNAVML
jgi:hypothetical protein